MPVTVQTWPTILSSSLLNALQSSNAFARLFDWLDSVLIARRIRTGSPTKFRIQQPYYFSNGKLLLKATMNPE